MNLTIRQAESTDAKEILEFIKVVGSESDNLTFGAEGLPTTLEQEQKLLSSTRSSENSAFFVARTEDGQIAATANFAGMTKTRLRHRGEIGITVRKSMWGKGVGTRMMNQLIEFAKNSAKVEIITLEVRSDNTRAIGLYEKFGFKRYGTFHGFFKINGELVDADCMNLYL